MIDLNKTWIPEIIDIARVGLHLNSSTPYDYEFVVPDLDEFIEQVLGDLQSENMLIELSKSDKYSEHVKTTISSFINQLLRVESILDQDRGNYERVFLSSEWRTFLQISKLVSDLPV